MTPSEKAKYLVMQMSFHQTWHKDDIGVKNQIGRAKQCAIVCVNEIMDSKRLNLREVKYYQDVIKEIENYE